MKQIIESKLGQEYTVTRKAMTSRKGQSFNPFSRSKQDLCILHNVNSIIRDEVVTGMIGLNSSTLVETSVADEGDVLTGVVEFNEEPILKRSDARHSPVVGSHSVECHYIDIY